jgi:UDPglucose 6-dehydrogenase
MRLTVFGAGYVGLVTGAGLADLGHEVLIVDIDAERIAQLRCNEVPIHEPGLPELINRNVRGGRLSFDTSVVEPFDASDAYFIAVGTPSLPDGSADVSAVLTVAAQIASIASDPALVVVKSTVPVGTCDKVQEIVGNGPIPPPSLEVVSNPEFLKEGSALTDFFRPDRVVIGTRSEEARVTMRALYAPLQLQGECVIATDLRSSELTKYAANTMLAIRISFMNELSRLCHVTKADIRAVRLGIGSDARIGRKFLYAGPGYGGSCLLGKETVLVRSGSRINLTRLSELFASLAEKTGVVTGAVYPTEMCILALGPDGVPAFYPCTAVTCRQYDGAIFTLRTKMGRRLMCTPDHPFVVINSESEGPREVLCRDLTRGDYLPLSLAKAGTNKGTDSIDVLDALHDADLADEDVIVRLDSEDMATVNTLSHTLIDDVLHHPRGLERSHEIRKTGALRLDEAKKLKLKLTHAAFGSAKNGTYIPRKIPLNERFWRVVGLYLAEGHRSIDGKRHRLSWTFHPTNETEMVDAVSSFWRDLGVKCDVWHPPTSMQVTVSSRILSAVFVKMLRLGTNSYNVRLPDEVWTISPEYQRALLAGLWQGDGSWSLVNGGPSVVFTYGTVSRELADGMTRLLAQHGVVASVAMKRMTKSTCDTWFLNISGADQIERAVWLLKPDQQRMVLDCISHQKKRTAPGGYRRISENLAAVRVVSKESKPYRGHVFSVEVEGAHTAVTTFGLVTHNCFPKDIKALIDMGRKYDVPMGLAEATHRANATQSAFLASLVQEALGDLEGKTVALWGLAFKPETDDVRDAPSLKLASWLLASGASVVGHDPEADVNFLVAMQRDLGSNASLITVGRDYDALDGVDALVLLTEWRSYLAPDFHEIKRRMRGNFVVDARNVWRSVDVTAAGLKYQGIGTR